MSKKEEKAKEYADNEEMVGMGFDRKELQWVFEAGWDESLKNQWIKIEDRMPKVDEYVFVMIEYERNIQIHSLMYRGETIWKFAGLKIIAWMQIPSFDNILENNKDVLKRLKDK